MTKSNPVRVLALGTFDLLHPGHLFYLEHAKKLGDKLLVLVARDSSVKKIKGRLPLNNEKIRLQMVSALKMVDDAFLGEKNFDGKKFTQVLKISPEIIALGYDQKVDEDLLKKKLERFGWKGKIVKIEAFKKEEFNSSKLREKLNNK